MTIKRPTQAKIPILGSGAYLYKRSETHLHRGVDLVAPKGQPVVAVEAGTVTHASAKLEKGFSGYGRHVVVHDVDGLYQLYAHLDSVDVKPGQKVAQGQQLGTVGDTCFNAADPGKVCGGSHLHFEVAKNPYPMRADAERVDPVMFLSGGEEFSVSIPTNFDKPPKQIDHEDYDKIRQWGDQSVLGGSRAGWLFAVGLAFVLLSRRRR